MTLIQIIVLALIQGLTEFLPVSSSAHLILGSVVFGWPDQGLVFDLATHLGTLLAVLFYFRRELSGMFRSCLGPIRTEQDRLHRAMMVYLAIASIPALLIGGYAPDFVGMYLRDIRIIAWTTVGFGLLLWLSDVIGSKHRSLADFSLKTALLVGIAQVFALVPGVSRSGVTITAGRLLGFSPDTAARFSFLLSIPIIAAAGVYGMFRVASGDARIDWIQFALAFVLSSVAGWICIAAFLALLKRVGLLPFVIYRLALGAVLFWFLNSSHQ